MKKKSVQVWRGFLAVFLSLSIALASLTGVANTWRSAIDQVLGTTSTKTTNDSKFVSVYSDSDELVDAHVALGEQVAEEGVVLLKNENNTLPLSSENPKVTLFGMGSVYPFMGGTMGSTVTGESQRDLVLALQEKGYEVNPTMLDIYKSFGNIVTGEKEGWGGKTPIYGNRPANFSTPYKPSEPALDAYVASKESGGGGAEAGYADSFQEYNDAAIVVFSRPGSEGSDYYPGEEGIDQEAYGTKSALGLTNNEKAVLELAKSNFETVIVLINSGSTMEIEDLKNDAGVNAILYIGFPGAYGFLGIADILNGNANPSGRLSDTYAVDTANAPAAQNFGRIALSDLSAITATDSLMGNLEATSPLGSFGGKASLAADHFLIEAEGIYTGYKYYETRYFDSVLGNGNASGAAGASNGASAWEYEEEVTYPFGYGLSYTSFSQTLNSVKADMDNQTVVAEVTVKNTGDAAGKSVAQLYVQTPYTEYDAEHNVEKSAIEFLGMEKTGILEPGAEEQLTITIDMKYLASWDSTAKDGKGGYILDGGDYYFALGNGAHDAVNNVLAAQENSNADGDAALVSVQKIGKEGAVDETTFAKSENGTEIVNQLQNADINYYKPDYATYLSRSDWEGTFPKTYDDLTIDGDKVDEWVQNLTNEVYKIAEGGKADISGSGGTLTLADLAGNDNINDPTWEELVRQIPVETLMAKIIKGGSVSDIIDEIASPLVYQNDGPNGFGGTLDGRGLNADDKNASFSMGTMANEVLLACTFNKDLLLEWGRLMGNDGLWSGNWLVWGSAANIHRCAYNGRNFEYYSEDPMLSNYMAAATVAGALEYGVIVGPKHLAFNDQESQRSGVAPYMTEQKAREGDLRAFQGAFEDAGAIGAMTSFSRIGATPVNGSVGVLKNILREEWGFKGLLSTDMVNNSGYFRPEMCIYAGVTMMADFGTDETMKQVAESWPYMTMDLVSQDEELVNYARENMKYQLYAFAHSAAQNVATEHVTPWWEKALYTTLYGSAALSVVCLGFYVVCRVKGKKEEE
ncbi:glycoside hydrolase family 3 protein [Anaerobium acetethylicum]|uniref:Beta-glucosidase n=1 Tax=Anaerobium acetethylicum TaxID=1619234 RepID=A0A1D3TSV5_9FIRM|nr:glycoside hydrolase family 3 protein [Anaerobium acetethylicum]SCP96999.1 beta-glucosidase [Anaerobium acetethylicum]